MPSRSSRSRPASLHLGQRADRLGFARDRHRGRTLPSGGRTPGTSHGCPALASRMGKAADWLREERRKVLGDWVAVCLGCGFAQRYFEEWEAELPGRVPAVRRRDALALPVVRRARSRRRSRSSARRAAASCGRTSSSACRSGKRLPWPGTQSLRPTSVEAQPEVHGHDRERRERPRRSVRANAKPWLTRTREAARDRQPDRGARRDDAPVAERQSRHRPTAASMIELSRPAISCSAEPDRCWSCATLCASACA